MTFDEWKILVKGLKSAYTSEKFLPDSDSVKVWFKLLGDLDYSLANAAVQTYIMKNKFPPSIAEIREAAMTILEGEQKDWGSGWNDVLTAIRKFGMYREQAALSSLDPVTRKCVERIGYRELCLSENIMADRANFRMIYENLQQREHQDSMIPEKLKEAINGFQLKGMDSVQMLSDQKCLECTCNMNKLKKGSAE